MKGNLTRMMGLALCALGLTTAAEAYTPVVVTGFNHDVIANTTGLAATSTTTGLDGAGYVFMDGVYNPTGTSKLPANGLINSAATSGLTFQLASYAGNNDLRVPATGGGQTAGAGSGTLTLATPQAAGEIYFLATSGDAATTVNVTVTFTDNTTQAFTGLTVNDWFGGTPFAVTGLGRVQRGVDNRENITDNPRMYQRMLTVATANISKLIQSITFNKTNTPGVLNVFAVTLNPVCSGTPAGGTPTASAASACSGTALTLNLPGSSPQIGISYQWQSSPAGANTFTNLGTSQATPTYTGATQTAATDYRVVVTCAGSGLSTTSGIVSVAQSSFIDCYCVPTGGNCTNEWVRGVTIGTLANTATICTTGGYVNYSSNTALTTTLAPGSSYPLTVDVRLNAANSQVGAWIDFNRNGIFEASEYTAVGTGPATGFAMLNTSFTATIAVPANASAGTTRMRIRSTNGALTAAQACTNGLVGETEDYLITLAAPVPCAGTPVAGTATASVMAACPNTPFTLDATGLAVGVSGLTFQWQSSPAGANTFTDIAGATTQTYSVANQTADTDYRLVVSCAAATTSANSTVVTVTRAPFYACYCAPTYVGGGTNDIIRLVALNNLSNNTAAASNVTPFYHDYSSQQPATLPIPDLATGSTATVNLAFGPEQTQFSAVWVDFDHSGVFDASEFFSLNTDAGSAGTADIPVAVPANAMLGLTKMRVRGGDDAVLLPTMACGASASDYGEAEDYMVNVVMGTGTRAGHADVALTAFPNPATSLLTVQVGTAAAQATAQLTDLTGRVLQTASVANQKATFSMSNLAAGIYLVRYSDGTHSQTIKVSKQ
jgi:hypothetical protein